MTKIKKSNPADNQANAEAAERVENSDFIQRCFTELEEVYTKEMVDSAPQHIEYRENAYNMLRALNRLQVHIQEYIGTGKISRSRVKGNVEGK